MLEDVHSTPLYRAHKSAAQGFDPSALNISDILRFYTLM
jgi:hypothetical protein